VITRPGVDIQTPVVNVDMLDLDLLFSNVTRDEQMIKLLVALVEDVGVPLNVRKIGKLIDLMKDGIEGCECCAGLDKFIAITTDDDVGVFINGKERLDECLS
jgi:hypothetical protein